MSKVVNTSLTVSQALKMCSSSQSEEFSAIDELHAKQALGYQWLARINAPATKNKKNIISYLSRKELIERAQEILKSPLASNAVLTLDQAIKYKKELRDLTKLKQQIERLEFLECHMDEYFYLGKIPFKPYIELTGGTITNKNIVDLCTVFRNEPSCKTEAYLARSHNSLSSMVNKYKLKFEQRFLNPRFNLGEPLKSITCDKGSDSSVTLNLLINSTPDDLMRVKSAARFWSSTDKKIKLNIIESNSSEAVKINRIAQGPSHVNMHERSSINLGPGLDHTKIIAHEIGHIFGFPDCYFEAWDKEKEAFLYLELDPMGKNLMCNVNDAATIPDGYFDQLKNAYCN